MKRVFCFLLILISVCSFTVVINAAELSLSAQAYELYCPDNGEVLLSSNASERLPMASTTKIMTALLALEYAENDNKVVEFTEDMTAEGSSMYLKIGERVTLDDLAVGMLMQSGNDAANAAAIAVSGSIEGFSDLMNQKAEELGMRDTHFVTPSGLDDDDHYSTAHDMALLMAFALNNSRFAEITSQTSMTVSFIEPADKKVTYLNHNKLLRMYDGCIGGKTGYTDKSGRCLVSAAYRGGLTLVAVTLNDRDDWDDHIDMYDYGFDKYSSVELKADHPDCISVVGGIEDTVGLFVEPSPPIVTHKADIKRIERKLFLPAFVYAPVQKGAIAGKVVYVLDGTKIGETLLRCSKDIDYNDRKRGFTEYIKDLLKWHS